ncbi:hypothetical protein Q9295_14715 [Xinfangfangia sp. CPCC 101601]|uniref:Sulfotransferase family protein n=1 Tax=Pseudogemmobacter lacusdianii TaxID=3069608 RepID=A0ABU0W155_9RHOB|nr:hypothetical protein [Xinfangfangia sp. CPCC 101601]MDQ2067628.1 hypothetical protein [Xinfangfangia sp. CPCC 101601]
MNKIYALWSHPRSMSTAMERVMRERGDLDCAHEPFMYDYYVHRGIRVMPHFDVRPDHPVAYQAIRDHLLERSEKGPVFFKDMSYYVMPHILEDAAFAGRLVNSFLIRDPVASITSYFKLDPEVTLDEVGLEAQWNHYSALKAAGGNPVVIRAEAVRADTRAAMASYWEKVGLPFSEAAFEWQSEKPKDWDQVGGWHGDVSSSNGIRPISEDEIRKTRENFDKLAEAHPKMRAYLDHHQVFYDRLSAEALI